MKSLFGRFFNFLSTASQKKVFEEKSALTIDQIAAIIRVYSADDADSDTITSSIEMDAKIQHVKCYFSSIHDNDYLVFKHFTDPGEAFIDIGANAGYSAASMWATGSRMGVISFEPIASYEKNLKEIGERAPFPHDYRICGLSDTPGSCVFYMPVCNGMGISAYTLIDLEIFKRRADIYAMTFYNEMKNLYNAEINTFSIYKFESLVSTLDTVLEQEKFTVNTDKIAVMKLDTEGHEFYVLKGSLATIEKHQPLLMIEHHNGDIEKLLREMGYTQVYRHGVNLSHGEQDKDNVFNYFYMAAGKINYYRELGLYL